MFIIYASKLISFSYVALNFHERLSLQELNHFWAKLVLECWGCTEAMRKNAQLTSTAMEWTVLNTLETKKRSHLQNWPQFHNNHGG